MAATSIPGRVLLVLAAVLALVAVVAVSSGLRTQPEHRVRIVNLPPDRLVALDAAGCPVDAHCQVRGQVPDAVTEAVRRWFPRAEPQWRSSTAGQSGSVFRITAQYLLNGDADTLLLNAECESGSSQAGRRRESSSAQQRSDLAGNQVAELTVREIIVPGAPGCSADLIIDVVGDGSAYDDGLQALSRDPAIQVRT